MLLISKCLAGEACRYDGRDNKDEQILKLMEKKDYVLACPEVLGGLSTPRIPCELLGDRVVNAVGEDCTEAFKIGAETTLRIAQQAQVHTAILKAKSPSCGHGTIYDGSFSRTLKPGTGMTASLLIKGGIRVLNETMRLGLHILVAYEVTENQKQALITHFPEHEFTFKISREASQEDLQAADVILGNPRSGQLKHCSRLKWLQLESAGYERYVAAEVLPKQVTLTNARGCYGPAVSEHMFATTLMLLKKLHLYRDLQQTKQWLDRGQVSSLRNAKVLVVGAGDIGRHYGRAVRQMGAKAVGIKRSMPLEAVETSVEGFSLGELWQDAQADFDALAQLKDFEQLAPMADIIALCAPDNEASQQLISYSLLQSLKSGTVIINAGRGSAIDQEAVVRILSEGKSLHFGLDVTSPEPLPKEHPLWQYENVFISPHISGGNHLAETFERLVALSIRNIEAFTRRETLDNVIVEGESPDGAETLK